MLTGFVMKMYLICLLPPREYFYQETLQKRMIIKLHIQKFLRMNLFLNTKNKVPGEEVIVRPNDLGNCSQVQISPIYY